MNKKKLLLIGITGTVLGLLLAWAITRQASATNIPKVDICHCGENHCETLNIATIAAIAHLKQHENDYKGQCEEPVTHLTCVEYACTEVEGEGENTCTTSEDCEPEQPTDVCTNLEGVQESTPEGYVNNDGYCYVPEVPEEEEPREDKPKTYSEDTRCNASTPPLATWFDVEDGSTSNNWHPILTWSAIGGDTTEIRFGIKGQGFPWNLKTTNDGRLVGGYAEEGNTGILGMIDYCYQQRTINECKTGEWSEVVCAFN